MKELLQSSTQEPIVFGPMVLTSDHITGSTGLTPTVTISKNGGAFASPSGAVSEIGNGWYKIAGNATDTNTLGSLVVHATGTSTDVFDERFEVVAYNPQSSTNLGLSAVASQTNITAGTITTTTNLTNAPTNGDFTSAMKTSLNAATPASLQSVSNIVSNGAITTSSGGLVSANATQINGSALAASNAALFYAALLVGTLQAGTTGTVTLPASFNSSNNAAYVGSWIITTGGTGPNQVSFIAAYNASTRVATLGTTLVTAPDSTTTFMLIGERV